MYYYVWLGVALLRSLIESNSPNVLPLLCSGIVISTVYRNKGYLVWWDAGFSKLYSALYGFCLPAPIRKNADLIISVPQQSYCPSCDHTIGAHHRQVCLRKKRSWYNRPAN